MLLNLHIFSHRKQSLTTEYANLENNASEDSRFEAALKLVVYVFHFCFLTEH